MIRVDAIVYVPEKRQPTEQELALMPIGVREQAQKNGIIHYRQLSSNGLGTAFRWLDYFTGHTSNFSDQKGNLV